MHKNLIERYKAYRRRGVSVFTATLSVFFIAFGWLFFTMKSPCWRWVYANRRRWFKSILIKSPRPADPIRYLLQGLWLLLIVQEATPQHFKKRVTRYVRYAMLLMHKIQKKLRISGMGEKITMFYRTANNAYRIIMIFITCLVSFSLAQICIILPLNPMHQLLFALSFIAVALILKNIYAQVTTIILILLSCVVSSRYLWWRYTTTINWSDPVSCFLSLLLIFAETFAVIVLFLGYLQTIWPLKRQPTALPADRTTWPTVDWMITTYNEDLSVVKPSVYAAIGVDWPEDKINIYLLDDGNRPAFKAFAQEVGIHYIARPEHDHAKAGNLNYALKQTSAEFVTVFDCDHVATNNFLVQTMGWFLKDPKLAILQTPHHFFTEDPFERNLQNVRNVPTEGLLFYGLIQDGNDMWDSTFFCGSSGILRRQALEDIGGIAQETVTEDAHTSIRIQRLGYTSAYIRIPLAAGMATVNLSSHIGQRVRWARGMTQIFRMDNPLLGKGLTLFQRLCYTNAILHFLSGIPRLIFLTAPLAFLLLNAYIIDAPALIILVYAGPHLFHAILTNSTMQGRFRLFFWGEFYETVLAWYIAWPTTVALFKPRKEKFNVTAKTATNETKHVDWLIARPYLIILGLNLLGAAVGVWRIFNGPENELTTICINLAWVGYNVIILGGALAVVVEAKQVRKSYRIEASLPAIIARPNGHLFPATLRDYSDGSVGLKMLKSHLVRNEEKVLLILKRDSQDYVFPCQVTRTANQLVGLRLDNLSIQQHIDFIQCTFARTNAWADWRDNLTTDKPWHSLHHIMEISSGGYLSLIEHMPPRVRNVLFKFKGIGNWLGSFIPQSIEKY